MQYSSFLVKYIAVDTFMVCWKSTSRQEYLLDGNISGVLKGEGTKSEFSQEEVQDLCSYREAVDLLLREGIE